jgi:hypothetical protein
VRTVIAFLIAVIVVASLTPFAIGLKASAVPQSLVWVLPFVGLFTVVIALPIYTSLPRPRQTQLLPLVAAGFVAAIVSFILFDLLFMHASIEQIGNTVYVRDGWGRLGGWRRPLQQTILMGVAGAVGGFAFWAARRLTIVGGGREA